MDCQPWRRRVTSRKPVQIEYPCRWLYKVITTDGRGDQQRIQAMLRGSDCRISLSSQSRTGKYVSLDVEIEVRDEAHRNTVYLLLQEMATVKMVL